jgi:alpha-tubulin suppressor-like RCC1 family protein
VSVSGLVSPAAYGAGRIVAMLPGAGDTAIVHVVPAVRHMSSTGYHTCLTTDLDEVLCWGRNSEGQVGSGAPAAVLQPIGTASELVLAQASAGWFHTGALAEGGAVLRWGPDVVQVGTDVETSLVSVGAMGQRTVLGLGTDGYAYTLDDSASTVDSSAILTELQAGFLHSCGLMVTGAPHCWGYDEYGELGRDSAFVGQFVSLTVGLYHTCGLTASGGAFCWGANADGQLGNGTRSRSRLPVAVQGGLQFTALQAGAYHTCGVTDEGEGYCWGWNGHGQLGDGTTVDRTLPVSVSGNLTFTRLAGGVAHTCGEAIDGRVWCWGLGNAGQLGDGRGEETWTPVAIVFAAPAGATAVVARGQLAPPARDISIDEPRVREAMELEARGRALCAARARGETISDLALAHVWQCR